MSSSPSNVLFYSMKCQTCNFFMTQAQKMSILKYFKLVCIDGQEKVYQAKGLKIIPTIIVQNNSTPIEGKGCLVWLENIVKSQKNKNIDNPNDQYLPETGIGQSKPIIPPSNSSNPSNLSNPNPNPNPSNNQQNQFQVPTTNVLKRPTNIIQPPPLTTTMKGKQVPNPSVLINKTQLNSLQSAQANLVQINSSENSSNPSNPNNPSVKTKNNLFGFLENEMSGCSDSYAYLLVDNALPKSFLPPDKDLQIYTAPEGNKLDKKTQELYVKNMELFRDNDKDEYKKMQEKQQKEAIQNNLRS